MNDVLELVREAYVDEPGDGLMAGALDGLTDALDPFSTYVPPAAVDGYLETRKVVSRHSGAVILTEYGVAYVAAVDQGAGADHHRRLRHRRRHHASGEPGRRCRE